MMNNNNLLLYGSVAREDSTKYSDIDLLTVGNEISNKYIVNNINVTYYNIDKFKEMAASGSLFIYHLNQEAKIIFDEGGVLNDVIYDLFSLKSNYNEEIYFAFDLFNEIINYYGETINYSFANSKLAWCLRTVYSGIGANQNLPLFSRKSLVEHFGYEILDYLNIKKNSTSQLTLLPKLSSHIKRIIAKTPPPKYIVRKDLLFFKEKVIQTLLSNQHPYDFY